MAADSNAEVDEYEIEKIKAEIVQEQQMKWVYAV